MKRLFFVLVVLVMLSCCAMAQGLTGQPYSTFETYYQDGISFLNDHTGRHMIPLMIVSNESEDQDGRTVHEIYGDVLTLSVRTDPMDEIIEYCQIILTAPSSMSFGSALHADFQVSGFHSHALLMAMHGDADALTRYSLVSEVEEGFAQSDFFSKQVGVYMFTGTRVNNVVTLLFENSGIVTENEDQEEDSATVEETPAPQQEDSSMAG